MPPRRKSTRGGYDTAGGYRSGLERRLASELKRQGITFEYETLKIPFLWPARKTTYTPDFILPNGIMVEAKGWPFEPKDRQKHVLIKEQHPHLDIRFVFQKANTPIRKGSKTTYAIWADKHGFKWAEYSIPPSWLTEPARGYIQDLTRK